MAFVAAPEPDAEVRYDFHDDLHNTYPAAEGWSLGVPELAGDPDGIGVEFGLRVLSFTQVIRDHKFYALQRMSALARELGRRTNWLLFQLDDTSAPVWFQTWRAEPGDLSFEHYYTERDRNYWEIGVSIPAEPHAVGRRVILASQTVTNDPAAASNPCSLVIPAQPGDAPTPLRVDVKWSIVMRGYRSMLTAMPDRTSPIFWQVGTGDVWTEGSTNTGAPVAKSDASGGSARLFSPPAGSTTAYTVISGAAPSQVPAGTYKVLVRVIRETGDGEFGVRLSSRYRDGTLGITGPYTFTTWGTTTVNHAGWLDLGEHSFPPGQSVDSDVLVTPDVAVESYRTSGTGGFFIDVFTLVPVDEDTRALFVNRQEGPGSEVERVDSDHEVIAWLLNGRPQGMQPPTLRGGFPVLHPGRDTTVQLLMQTKTTTARFNGAETLDRVADTATVTISYQPRWLWIGEG